MIKLTDILKTTKAGKRLINEGYVNSSTKQGELFDEPEQYSMSNAAKTTYKALEQSVKNAYGNNQQLQVQEIGTGKQGTTIYTVQRRDGSAGYVSWMRFDDKGHIVDWPILRGGLLQLHPGIDKHTKRPFTEKDVDWFSYVLKADRQFTYPEEIRDIMYGWNNDDWMNAIDKYNLK